MDNSVIKRFAEYYKLNPAWGGLHIVLSDGNINDSHVIFCRECAIEENDLEAVELAKILLSMSKTQRKKLPYLVKGEKE